MEAPVNLSNYEETIGRKGNRWGLNSPFRRAELDKALRSCRDKSNLGLDGIYYKILKYLPNIYRDKLLERELCSY